MFEISSAEQNLITISTKQTSVTFDIVEAKVSANLSVGEISGPGEFEIGDVSIRGIMTESKKTIYDVEVNGVHVGILGDTEEGFDEFGIVNILCTSSVRAIREIEPRVVVATGNVDGMVTELKLSAKTEKKMKVKSVDALSAIMEVVVLN